MPKKYDTVVGERGLKLSGAWRAALSWPPHAIPTDPGRRGRPFALVLQAARSSA